MKSVIALISLGSLASAWWDGPHVLSAEIAARYLKETNKTEVLDMVNKVFYSGADLWPCHSELQSSATWLDYAKNRARTGSSNSASEELGYLFVDHLRMWDRFHYYDALYVDEAGREALKWPTDWTTEASLNLDAHFLQNQTLNTITFALGQAESALWGSKLDPEDKTPWSLGMNLHHVTHLIGDLHMPCHTAAMWNWDDYSKGHRGMHDEGANYIPVKFASGVCQSCEDAKISNLHAFWDAMGGYETRNRFDIWGKTDEKVTDIMKTHPAAGFESANIKLKDATLLDIMKESFALEAIPDANENGYHVYKGVEFKKHFCAPDWRTVAKCTNAAGCPGADCYSEFCQTGCADANKFVITKEYVDFAVKASKKRIALTGYRMAHRLIKAYESMTDELKDRVNQSYEFARSRQRSVNDKSGCVQLRQPTSGAEMNVLAISVPLLLGALAAFFN